MRDREKIHVSEIVGQPDEHIIDAQVENHGGSFILVTQHISNRQMRGDE